MVTVVTNGGNHLGLMHESSPVGIMVDFPFFFQLCRLGVNAINKVIKAAEIVDRSGSKHRIKSHWFPEDFDSIPFCLERWERFLSRYMQMHMLAHHPPIREAPVRMLSEQMFSLLRVEHCPLFLLAL